MPGTLATGPASTVEAALLMFPASKPMSGTATGEIPSSAAGVPPCQLPAAVTCLPGPSRRKISEVIPRDRRRPPEPAGHPIGFSGDARWPALRRDRTAGTRVRQGHPRKKMGFTANGIPPAAGSFRGKDAADLTDAGPGDAVLPPGCSTRPGPACAGSPPSTTLLQRAEGPGDHLTMVQAVTADSRSHRSVRQLERVRAQLSSASRPRSAIGVAQDAADASAPRPR